MRIALSTVTKIVSRLLAESGRSVMKSMEISLHFVSGMWVDCSFPLASVWSDFPSDTLGSFPQTAGCPPTSLSSKKTFLP